MASNAHLPYLVPVLQKGQRRTLHYLISVWLLSLIIFLIFWFRQEHVITWNNFMLNTMLLLWINILPGYFFYFISRMRQVNPGIIPSPDWKVAMITTRAPSEPFSIVIPTLLAMKNQVFHHDTWLADEDPDGEIVNWCKENDIQLCSRKGIPDYHRDTWPRRTKCKEGNLAYFYDQHGYNRYDIVVQLDADHIPGENYLEEMIRPFVNEEVGYVSAPSICDANISKSWTARGRLYAEAIMHGPLQAGYTHGFAPLCIGSHYAVRTRALKEIGGLGPELAEDHSTTLMMIGHGWKGVHAIKALASGEGPPGISECITQEFQWSRSLMILLLTQLPQYWRKLSIRLRIQFLFSELWYPIFGLMFLIGTFLPVIAVITGEPWVSVSFIDFILYSFPVTLSVMSVIWFLKKNKLFRPVNAPIISWEIMLFQILRWPWAVYGSLMGIAVVLRKKTPVFKVTPKGGSEERSLSWMILLPYIVLILLSALPGIFIQQNNQASGYHYFLFFNVITYNVLLFCILISNYYEARS